MGDHLIDAAADGVGGGRMADDNLLTDLLILSRWLLPLAKRSDEE